MMQGVFAVLFYKYDISCVPKGTNSLYISLNSKGNMLSYNINHMLGIFLNWVVVNLKNDFSP